MSSFILNRSSSSTIYWIPPPGFAVADTWCQGFQLARHDSPTVPNYIAILPQNDRWISSFRHVMPIFWVWLRINSTPKIWVLRAQSCCAASPAGKEVVVCLWSLNLVIPNKDQMRFGVSSLYILTVYIYIYTHTCTTCSVENERESSEASWECCRIPCNTLMEHNMEDR